MCQNMEVPYLSVQIAGSFRVMWIYFIVEWSLIQSSIRPVYSSVTDPDPVGSGRIRSFWVTRIQIQENTRSVSFIHKKAPEILISSLYKIQFIYLQFRQKKFLPLILSVIRCLELV